VSAKPRVLDFPRGTHARFEKTNPIGCKGLLQERVDHLPKCGDAVCVVNERHFTGMAERDSVTGGITCWVVFDAEEAAG